ncbi:MAG: glycosyltransferase family 2 protein [Saprospiraceae bacterium]
MKTKSQVSCVIPFYNEGERLFQVLEEVVKIRNVVEIICVDDASDEDQTVKIQERFPIIHVIRLPENQGKAGAVRAGVAKAVGEYILLIDADLQNLQHKEIEKAITALQHYPDVDMLILRRMNANLYVKLNRADTLFTGERILRKTDLEKVYEEEIRGWQLESAINNYMIEHDKKVYWMPQSATNTQKTSKWGFFAGIRNNLKTHADMMFAMGFFNFLKQYFFFAKDELKLGMQTKRISAEQ